MLKEMLVAVSLANLCFIQGWRSVADPASEFYFYHSKQFTGWVSLAAITINVVLLAAVFFAAARLARRSGSPRARRLARYAFILALLFALNGIRLQFGTLLIDRLARRAGVSELFLLGLLAPVVVVAVVFAVGRIDSRKVVRAGVTLLLVLAPLVVITFSQAAWLGFKYARSFDERPPAPLLPAKGDASPRVLWLVFDEFDYRVTFDSRPAALALPELDRLRAESVFAARAYAPGGDTLQSMPALIDGRLVAQAERTAPDKLRLRFHEETGVVEWGDGPNVFSRARELGRNTALVGWHHPYCRVIGDDLNVCKWESSMAVTRPERSGVVSYMRAHVVAALKSLPMWQRSGLGEAFGERLSPTVDVRARKTALIELYEFAAREARALATRDDLGLTLIHWAPPHPPGIYERATGRVTPDAESSYLDNLALIDHTLGDLRRLMEEAQVWDKTTVLVTSDHWLRERAPNVRALLTREDLQVLDGPEDHRVPFILKLAGRREGVVYEPAFNAVVTHDLLLGVLRGELRTGPEVVRWLDAQRTPGESPYYKLHREGR